MNDWTRPLPPRRAVPRVGVATHDERFLAPVREAVDRADSVVRRDVWTGHRMHHPHLSRYVARWADLVFAEWCLGNAVWHAAHRRDGARLVVRFHRFELDTEFPAELDIDAVEAVVFVGEHVRDEAIARFGWPAHRCRVIHNPVDTDRFDLPKARDAHHTLGMLTWNRRLKRLDLALDLLETLRADDPRYQLRLKGRRPEQAGHVWKYDEERVYFEEQYARIDGSPLLGGAVHVDPEGPDVPAWFTGVGHILSLSDVESFHLALAEGMASRAVPVVRRRVGADTLFSPEWIVDDVVAGASAISARLADDLWSDAGARARAEILRKYDRRVVLPSWIELLSGRSERSHHE